MPEQYRNVLCPWQTEREIRSQVKTLEKMLKGRSEEEVRQLLRLDQPDRVWWSKKSSA